MDTNAQVAEVEKKIDDLILKALALSNLERASITDVLDFSVDLFQEGDDSEAYKPASPKCLDRYVKQLCESLGSFLKDSTLKPSVGIYDMPNRSPLRLIALKLSTHPAATEQVERVEYSEGVNDLLRKIDDYSYEKHSESIYFRKTIKYLNGDTIYLIKPNEMRFWSKSAAANDASELTFEILNSPA